MRFKIFVPVILLLLAFSAQSPAEEAPEKPGGFQGYLLDASGLGGEEKEAAWKESFETEGVSWRYLYQDGSVGITGHSRVEKYAREGKKSEYIGYDVIEPGVVVFGHYVDYPAVYDETAPSLWLRSNRPGVAIGALVVFPKTPRPDNGKPLVVIVPGAKYQNPGEWQKLDFPQGLRSTVEKTAQGIRGEHHIPVNIDGAYVRQLLLISEARSGSYQLWIDDLQISEHLRPDANLLRTWERGAQFEPVNLLSCRLQLSSAPVFALSDDDSYGREPFGVDEEKAAESRSVKLEFAPDALVGAARNKQNAAFSQAPKPTFEDAYTLLKPTTEEYLAGLDELLPHRSGRLDVLNAQNALASRSRGGDASVGQVSFTDGAGQPGGHVANVAFDDANGAPVGRPGGSDAEYVALSPQDELVSGSGTMTSAEDAVTEAFRRQGERLVANAQFRGGVLETPGDRRVYSIRAIEYQGEPFEFLKKLGFNAVWLHAAPNANQLREANDLGIWLISPVPSGAEFVTDAAYAAAANGQAAPQSAGLNPSAEFGGQRAGSAYDGVLLWQAGAELRRSEAPALLSKLERIRSLDPLSRPIIGSALTGVDEFARSGGLDALLLRRAPVLTSLDMQDYGDWLVKYQYLVSNLRGVFWNTIQTQPAPTATQQRQFFGMVDESPGIVSYEQMRQMTRLSMRAKCRGLVFSSFSRLDAEDHKTQYRAAALEALNLELQLIAPWFALGEPEEQYVATSQPSLSGVISRTKRSLLLAPVSLAANNQYVMGADAAPDWSATIPVKDGYAPDLLAPGALRKLIARRQAGGVNFTLEEGSMNSLLFFAQSESVTQKVSERAPAYGARMAKLAISLARKRLDLYEETVYRLHYVEEHGYFPKSAPPAPALGNVVEKARDLIEEAETCLKRKDVSQAYLVAEQATREIRNYERRFWQEATKSEIARPVTPLSTSFYDMPAYLELYEKLMSGKIAISGENLIQGGDMENVWQNSDPNLGWHIYNEPSSILRGVVSFDAKAAKNGSMGLCVSVEPVSDSVYVPEQTESPVVYVETTLNANIGDLVCVQGWIKIPNDLTNSVDGVSICDDQGGEALAVRFVKATEWKHFAFYRRATNNGTMRLRFSFSGLGEVYLDEVAAYVVR